MSNARNNGEGGRNGNGTPFNNEVLKFLAQLVKGQAELTRRLDRHQKQTSRWIRTLLKVSLDSHRRIQGLETDVGTLKSDVSVLKSDVGDLKRRMGRVEERVDGRSTG